VSVISDNKERTLIADADYVLKSIRHPNADVVKGYPAIMPAFDHLPEEELGEMVEYIRELR
jgi:cytochrome c oxidase subunit 2